jgi:S-(hydroxymethyl)glutathione dehydrogenase/alcohol dehydrogenase
MTPWSDAIYPTTNGGHVKSLAAVVRQRGASWTIEEIDVDPPGSGEVLVEWAAAGLCHSDEHFRDGDRVPPELAEEMYPFVGGHEGAGIVSQVGADVDGIEVGDHVVAAFAPTCGECRYCTSRRGSLCNANKDFMRRGQLSDGAVRHRLGGSDVYITGKLGTFAERTVVSRRSVVVIDPATSLDAACLVSCGVATGWGSAVHRAETQPGDVVVVVGLGGLGISAVQGARYAGAEKIIGIDPIEFRRDAATKFGATETAGSLAAARPIIDHATDGQGADRVVMMPSLMSGPLIADGLSVTGKGGTCVVTGMAPIGESAVPIDIGAFALMSKDLRGCLFGSFDPRYAPEFLLGLYQRGELDLDAMITTYPLANINDGWADTLGGSNIRGVLRMA